MIICQILLNNPENPDLCYVIFRFLVILLNFIFDVQRRSLACYNKRKSCGVFQRKRRRKRGKTAVQRELFEKAVSQAAQGARKRLRLVEKRTQSPDHPVLWGAGESYYLKFYIFQLLNER